MSDDQSLRDRVLVLESRLIELKDRIEKPPKPPLWRRIVTAHVQGGGLRSGSVLSVTVPNPTIVPSGDEHVHTAAASRAVPG